MRILILFCLISFDLYAEQNTLGYPPLIYAIEIGRNDVAINLINEMRTKWYDEEHFTSAEIGTRLINEERAPTDIKVYGAKKTYFHPGVNALEKAIQKGNIEMVEALLNAHVNTFQLRQELIRPIPKELQYKDGIREESITPKIFYHKSPLSEAIDQDNGAILKLLIKKRGDLSTSIVGPYWSIAALDSNQNVIQYALAKNHPEMIKTIIEGLQEHAGVSLPITDEVVSAFQTYGSRGDLIFEALKEGDFEAIDLFFHYGVYKKKAYLEPAAQNEEYLSFLIGKGYLTIDDLVIWNTGNIAVLNSFYHRGYITLDQMVQTFKKITLNYSHLIYAIELGQDEIAEALLEPYTPDKINDERRSGLHVYAHHPKDIAGYYRHFDTTYCRNALETAIDKGNAKMVELLLKKGADPFVFNKRYDETLCTLKNQNHRYFSGTQNIDLYYETPFYLAIVKGDPDCLSLLSPYADLNRAVFKKAIVDFEKEPGVPHIRMVYEKNAFELSEKL